MDIQHALSRLKKESEKERKKKSLRNGIIKILFPKK